MFSNKGKSRIDRILHVLLMVHRIICTEKHQKNKELVYILMWTNPTVEPFVWWAKGHQSFVTMNCEFQNCFFIDNQWYLPNITDYHVIIFNAVNVNKEMDLPRFRTDSQMYFFVSTESDANFPISDEFNLFFNYTWTYKLNSDISYPYFVVRNIRTGKVLAPRSIVHWKAHKRMKRTLKSVIKQLRTKSIGAAWFVSNCLAINQRLIYATKLREELLKLGHKLDFYGPCLGNNSCPRFSTDCLDLLKNRYYFYLSFENSFSDDYVTEKILTAVNNFAVPVVYGGADYSRY